jgi:hypothetical protein
MRQQINLFDPEFERKAKPFAARTMAASLALFGGIVLLQYGYAVHQARDLERTLRETDERLSIQRQQMVRVSGEMAAVSGGQALTDELARTEARLAARKELLASITSGISASVEGYSALMGALARRVVQGLWLTGFTASDTGAVAIRGRVLDAAVVPSYLGGLNAEEAFRSRSLSELRIAAPAASPASRVARALEFTIGMTPKGSPQ